MCMQINWMDLPAVCREEGGKKQTVADFSKWHHLSFIIQYKGKPPLSKGGESYTIVTPVQTHWRRFNRTNMGKTILQCDFISTLTHFFFLKCRQFQIPRHRSSWHCPLVELWEELMTRLLPLPSAQDLTSHFLQKSFALQAIVIFINHRKLLNIMNNYKSGLLVIGKVQKQTIWELLG